jgi:hypothetical protein
MQFEGWGRRLCHQPSSHLLTEETPQEQFCYGCRIVLTNWASSVSMWLSTHAEHHLMLRVYFRIAKLVAILPFDGHMCFSEIQIVVPCHPNCCGTD